MIPISPVRNYAIHLANAAATILQKIHCGIKVKIKIMEGSRNRF